jgi:hypothetical protein
MALSAILRPVGQVPSSQLQVYKGKAFMRFARKARIPDTDLWRAAQRANDGAIDADLGRGVIKQRIARSGEGKSGGSRSIILFRKNNRAVCVYGFEKKDAANIDRRELEAFRELAKVILNYTDTEIEQRVTDGALFHVEEPGEDNAWQTSK